MTDERRNNTDRGVSSTVSYVLAIGITIVLVGGLVFTFGGLLDGNLARTTDSELRVISEGIATELMKVDAVVSRTDGAGTHATLLEAPRTVAGQDYRLSVGPDACSPTAVEDACVRVETSDRAHTVPLNLTSDLEGTVDGGDVWIVATNGTIELTMERPS